MEIQKLLKEAIKRNASDLHLVANLPPALRIEGEIILMDKDKLAAREVGDLVYQLFNDEQKKIFEKELKISFSTLLEDFAHLRISAYKHLGNVEAAIRIRALEIKSLEELGLPPVAGELTRKANGLVLITGSTGVGKTTTFYSMIDLINSERRCKIITVEDPVEFAHHHKRSVVIQQEIGLDTKSFYSALVHILRLDPDIIGVGETRDLETISTALTAAETGHLVIATLHTPDASQTINRIIDVYPPHQQPQVRAQLAGCLKGIISQALLPAVDKKKRVLACEVLVANDAVRNLIREDKIQNLYSVMQTGKDTDMQTMDASLKELYQKGIITYDVASSYARNPKSLREK